MPTPSLLQQLDRHQAKVKRLGWITVGGGVMAAASMLLSSLVLPFAVSSGWRIGVALASGLFTVAAVLAARTTKSRLDEFQWAMSDLAERARDLKARAAIDPVARAEYVAYLRGSRAEVERMCQKMMAQGYITENQMLPALNAMDAEIAIMLPKAAESPGHAHGTHS